MPDSPTSKSESDFVCGCEEWARTACAGEPFYREHNGRPYCVLHFPGKEKREDFRQAFQRKLENKDFDFGCAWFPDDVSFEHLTLTTEANFSNATFNGEASFLWANFSAKASFVWATFNAF